MEAKEWYKNSKYLFSLDEHDEGGFLGIDDNKVAEMLEEYHQAKLKLLGIADVSVSLKQGVEGAVQEANKHITEPKCVREGKVKRNER